MTERTLEEFVDWWWETRVFRPPVDAPVLFDGSITGVVLYRDAPFQVQLFTVAPGVEIPDHVHPNVDSYENLREAPVLTLEDLKRLKLILA